MKILQNVLLPDENFIAPEQMFITPLGKSRFDYTRKSVIIPKNEVCRFNTYFNSVSMKNLELLDINTISLSLEVDGECLVRFYTQNKYTEKKLLCEKKISGNNPTNIDLNGVHEESIVSFEIYSLDDVIMLGGKWLVECENIQKVKLGLVITHFNRQDSAKKVIGRLRKNLLATTENIELVVVDNSQNLGYEHNNFEKIHIIKNENYGGSGGFTRGLLYLKDNGFTHCLFMDDDASCHEESIRRTFFYLENSKKDKLAISGTLFRENYPTIVHENGAHSGNGNIISYEIGLDVGNYNSLPYLYNKFDKINYGGWWFFAFNISDIEQYPFPFFVRGDDMLFGSSNPFFISTLLGVCSWSEDFTTKESPLTRYLGFRACVVNGIAAKDFTVFKFLKLYSKWFLSSLFSYNYNSSFAINKSLESVFQGTKVFINDMTGSQVREYIKQLGNDEKMQKISLFPNVVQPIFKVSFIHKVLRILLLNGFLLPNFLLKNQCVFQQKGFRATFREIYRYKHVFYYDSASNTGYFAHFKRKIFFTLFFAWLKNCVKIFFSFKKMHEQYINELPTITTESFWKSHYNLDERE